MEILDKIGLSEFNLKITLGAINIITIVNEFDLRDRDPRWIFMDWPPACGVVHVRETHLKFDLEGIEYSVVCWEYSDCSDEQLPMVPDYLLAKAGKKFCVIKNVKDMCEIIEEINSIIYPYKVDLFKG